MAKKIVKQWLNHSVRDLQLAYGIIAMGNEHRYAAAFHAQQSAEKAAKALLVHHNLRPPRTHDLEELSLLIGDIDPKLSTKLKRLKSLTRFAVIFRYPDAERKSVSVATIKIAIKGAQGFYDLAAGHIMGKTALSQHPDSKTR